MKLILKCSDGFKKKKKCFYIYYFGILFFYFSIVKNIWHNTYYMNIHLLDLFYKNCMMCVINYCIQWNKTGLHNNSIMIMNNQYVMLIQWIIINISYLYYKAKLKEKSQYYCMINFHYSET